MPVHNADIAEVLNRLADLLEIEGANRFRVRAYRTAAQTVGSHSHSIADLIAAGEDLKQFPGIGDDLAQKIAEYVDTGHLPGLKDVEERVPPQLRELSELPGIGPKRVKALFEELDIKSLDDLAKAAKAGEVREISGFGKKTEQKILTEIERLGSAEKRYRLPVAEQMIEPLVAYLKDTKGVKDVVVAGSYRRRKDTVGDADILVTCKKDSKVIDRFTVYEDVEEIISKGSTRSSVRLRSGFQVDLRVVPEVSYGAAMHYFTGSKAHNIAIRRMGVDRGLKINEYGVFKGDERIAGRTEAEVFEQVGLPYIVPELRENRGEIEAARHGRLPKLVSLDDIRGDLHSHTKASDGRYTLKEMAEAARAKGYAYLAVTDHTKSTTVAGGLDADRLARQIDEIDRLNETLNGFRLLKSSEVDILEDGTLDLPDDILARLDLTVCSIHAKFDLSWEKQTRRVLKAMDNRRFNIFGHPTGRLIGERPAYEIDLETVIEGAKERGCFVELNSQPERLDLDDVHCKMAKDIGVKIAISTDSHATANLDFMRFGVAQARRGWLEADDVLNTRSWDDLRKLLKRG